MADYLSSEWIDALRAAARADEELARAAAEVELVLQQHVTDTPEGTVSYYVTFDRGEVFVQAGEVAEPDVAFVQDYATATAVARGELNALEALQKGKISIHGDARALTRNQQVLAALDHSFSQVRTETTYR
ncbi:MAG TPA: SCP2 sterol-binding domain-containing protein [Acidimicrobiales bacterium]|nr:SCP2 sterol-binding domain-containing protein [Acidimicrobiales bacterium]